MAGKQAARYSITARQRHSPATLPSGSVNGNRHEPELDVSAPADIQGGDAVADERPSGVSDALSVRTYPAGSVGAAMNLSQPGLRIPRASSLKPVEDRAGPGSAGAPRGPLHLGAPRKPEPPAGGWPRAEARGPGDLVGFPRRGAGRPRG